MPPREVPPGHPGPPALVVDAGEPRLLGGALVGAHRRDQPLLRGEGVGPPPLRGGEVAEGAERDDVAGIAGDDVLVQRDRVVGTARPSVRVGGGEQGLGAVVGAEGLEGVEEGGLVVPAPARDLAQARVGLAVPGSRRSSSW